MPKRETEEDRTLQRALAERIARQWDIDTVHMCSSYYHVDAVFERDGKIVGIAEVKGRTYPFGGPFGGYKNFFLSAAKVTEALSIARTMIKPCILIVGFSDSAHWCDLDQFERNKKGDAHIIWGGRPRGDANDYEPMFTYAWKTFTPLEAT